MRATLHGVGNTRNDLDARETVLEIGAAVVRHGSGGGIDIDFGPADGPAQIRFFLSQAEAHRLTGALRSVAQNGAETVIFSDD
jgi:hypothetical protein